MRVLSIFASLLTLPQLVVQKVGVLFVVSIFLAGCFASTRHDHAREQWLESKRGECESSQGVCFAEMLPALSIEALKRKNSEIRIDCGLDFIDYSEETAQAQCEKNVLAAMTMLVEQRPDQLLPVKSAELSFNLNDEGCITLSNGYCACTFTGSARVPLVWKTP